MTVAVTTPPAQPAAAHTFSLPIVREIPPPAIDPAGDRTW